MAFLFLVCLGLAATGPRGCFGLPWPLAEPGTDSGSGPASIMSHALPEPGSSSCSRPCSGTSQACLAAVNVVKILANACCLEDESLIFASNCFCAPLSESKVGCFLLKRLLIGYSTLHAWRALWRRKRCFTRTRTSLSRCLKWFVLLQRLAEPGLRRLAILFHINHRANFCFCPLGPA